MAATLGRGVTAAHRTLDPLIQVRILAPQPDKEPIENLCVWRRTSAPVFCSAFSLAKMVDLHSTIVAYQGFARGEWVMDCEAVILAAGLGTRMKSRLPKVLHPVLERPMIWWAVQAAYQACGAPPTLVIGPDAEGVRQAAGEGCRFAVQRERLGTGHALAQAEQALHDSAPLLLVTSADMPLLRAETLQRLIQAQRENDGPLSLLTARVRRTRGFGRILRDGQGAIVGIVEEAHATPEQLALDEVNVGVYCLRADWVWPRLRQLPLSPKGEYYLTDLVAMAAAQGQVGWLMVEDEEEIIGVNTRVHLAEAEAAMRRRINHQWMLQGVTIVDPQSTYIGPQVELGRDTVLLPNTYLLGTTRVGADCEIGPNTHIRDSQLGDRCQVRFSVLEGATLEEEVDVGPFAHLRRGAHLCRGVHMGNFGEVKNSTLGPGVKMGHFSYVGDTVVGANSNIGAGAITCNFDGERKHRTEIGEDAFIGSDTMLVAPLKVGRGARTGAGSVVTRDVPPNTLVAGVPARAIRKLDQDD